MNKTIIIIILIFGLLIIGGYFLLFKPANQTSYLQQYNQSQNQVQEQNNQTENNNPQNEVKNEVIYTDSGYFPSVLTIKLGDKVTFKNQSSKGMWTASALHPSHSVYSGTSLNDHCPDTNNVAFDQCKSAQPGESWSFTFEKKGTFGYHNHVEASRFGKITVE